MPSYHNVYRGLGKSLQALTAIAVLRVEKHLETRPSLVVCPASLVLHWAQEAEKFFPPALLAPHRYAKPVTQSNNKHSAAKHAASPLYSSNALVIVSYDSLRANLTHFQGVHWAYVVLDEAHLIRNPATATAKAIFGLRSSHRMALTGTPVQNQVRGSALVANDTM